MTKEGKLDVSFLRVDKTKKQIPKFEKKHKIEINLGKSDNRNH